MVHISIIIITYIKWQCEIVMNELCMVKEKKNQFCHYVQHFQFRTNISYSFRSRVGKGIPDRYRLPEQNFCRQSAITGPIAATNTLWKCWSKHRLPTLNRRRFDTTKPMPILIRHCRNRSDHLPKGVCLLGIQSDFFFFYIFVYYMHVKQYEHGCRCFI